MSSHDGDHVNRILTAATKRRDGKPVTCDRCGTPLLFTGRERPGTGTTPMVIIAGHCPNTECPDAEDPRRIPPEG
ncbi:hypothetical protein ACFY12_18620 [Streptomyces sp. NPDC001339]|uniref:hypothetical protein n=1 Tax=Streptomyces sp. NPDC001339 TaxID=3364563 RepID=UPI0036AD191E